METVLFNNCSITVEQVLLAQGMNPGLVRDKKPKLMELTRQGIEVCAPYLDPRAALAVYAVSGYKHDRIVLENGNSLSGELIGRHLPGAQKVALAVCTVGSRVGEYVAQLFNENLALAMAVEGAAAAATEWVANQVCYQIGENSARDGLVTSLPINPGMVGWPVEEGQPQLFANLDTSSIGVELVESGVMKPLKSLSMVVGIGSSFDQNLTSCDLCGLQKTCTHHLTADARV